MKKIYLLSLLFSSALMADPLSELEECIDQEMEIVRFEQERWDSQGDSETFYFFVGREHALFDVKEWIRNHRNKKGIRYFK
jgi:hypothetical protein